MSAAARNRMSPAKFLEAVRKGKRFEMLLLCGEEEFLLREALREYVSRIVSPESADFNYCEYRAGEVSAESLWNSLITLPFAGDLRLIVLDLDVEPPKDVVKGLLSYSRRPSATTSLVMTFVGDRRRLDWGDEEPVSLVEVEFKPLHERERMAWSEAYAKRSGKRLHADAASYLIETTSRSLSDLAAKLNHAILFVGEDPDVSVQVLMKVSGVSSEYTVFQLQDAILAQKAVEAHRIARSLLEGGEALLRLLAFHRGMLMRLWQTSRGLRKMKSLRSQVEIDEFWKALLGGQLFKKNNFMNAAERLGEARLRRAVQGLLELEVEAKTTSHEPHSYFEWLWRVCGQGFRPSEPAFQLSR
jgi:DNA polymerase-3 subunit delta